MPFWKSETSETKQNKKISFKTMEEIDYFAFYLFLVLTVFIVLVCASELACAGLYTRAHAYHSNHDEIRGQLVRVRCLLPSSAAWFPAFKLSLGSLAATLPAHSASSGNCLLVCCVSYTSLHSGVTKKGKAKK